MADYRARSELLDSKVTVPQICPLLFLDWFDGGGTLADHVPNYGSGGYAPTPGGTGAALAGQSLSGAGTVSWNASEAQPLATIGSPTGTVLQFAATFTLTAAGADRALLTVTLLDTDGNYAFTLNLTWDGAAVWNLNTFANMLSGPDPFTADIDVTARITVGQHVLRVTSAPVGVEIKIDGASVYTNVTPSDVVPNSVFFEAYSQGAATTGTFNSLLVTSIT